MSKRFTDTDKWKKKFIRSLEAPYKVLWLYILDSCDHAGIWHVDIEVAEIRTGFNLNYYEALIAFKGKIFAFDDDEKWFIPDFINFQYGELNNSNRVHKSVFDILTKYNLIEYLENKDLISPLQGVKDKDKYKDKDKVKDKAKDKEKKTKKIKPDGYDLISFTEKEIESLNNKYSSSEAKAIFDKLEAYKLASGKVYKSDYGAINSWVADSVLIKSKGKHAINAQSKILKEIEEGLF